MSDSMSHGTIELMAKLEAAIDALPPEACCQLVGEIERVKARLWSRLMAATVEPPVRLAAKPLLTVAQAADQLHVSKVQVYELIRQGRLPAVKVGKYVRLDPAVLATWMAAGGT